MMYQIAFWVVYTCFAIGLYEYSNDTAGKMDSKLKAIAFFILLGFFGYQFF